MLVITFVRSSILITMKENSSGLAGGETSSFRKNDVVLVLGVPLVVVRERVQVRVELTTIVDVHVDNEESCDEPSVPLPA